MGLFLVFPSLFGKIIIFCYQIITCIVSIHSIRSSQTILIVWFYASLLSNGKLWHGQGLSLIGWLTNLNLICSGWSLKKWLNSVLSIHQSMAKDYLRIAWWCWTGWTTGNQSPSNTSTGFWIFFQNRSQIPREMKGKWT